MNTDHFIDGWAKRVYACVHDLCKFLTAAMDLETIVFHGLIPDKVMHLLVELAKQRMPPSLPEEFAVPDVIASPWLRRA